MAFLEFLILSLANLALMFYIVRKRSIASAEGFCAAYLGMAALTDNVELIYHYCVVPVALPLGYRELSFRVYPTAVEILGLLVLIAGLSVIPSRSTPITRELGLEEIQQLRHFGVSIATVGTILIATSLYLVHALSAPKFYVALNAFRSQALPFGGFWYRGADVVVFGLALMLPSLRGKPRKFLGVLALMMFVSFFLRTNKGGLEEPLLWAAIIVYVYDRVFFRSMITLRNAAFAGVIAFIGMGAKLWFLPIALHQPASPPTTLTKLIEMASSTAATRWGDNSLYRGYCQFVNLLPQNRQLFRNAKVGTYTLTSWIPRLLYPHKPDHPFRGLGFMIYSDFHSFPTETPAPTLMGSVMADDGLLSLVPYLFLAGVFLSALREIAARAKSSLYAHVGYLIFVLFGGFSAEEGILGLAYTLLLAYGIVLAACLLLGVWHAGSSRSATPSMTRKALAHAGGPEAQF
jgi:hypothetical protein